MATFTLSQINNSTGGSKRTLASSAPAAALNYSVQASQQVAESQNNGGILGGVGYLFEKVGLGFLSGIEGIWDYGAGGIAKLFGADDWAEQQFANDWVNYNDADEWFNPSDGWRVAGDVAGGIGTSLPAIAGTAAGAAIAYFSGGTLSPLAAGIISGSIAGFGAAGNATKEAYYETGNLGAKEFGYGFLSGATEAGVEFLSAGLAKGTGRIVSSIAKSTAKETAETVAKTGAKSVIKNLLSDFAQEAFEEGLSEILSPVYQRMTYNPDAENATPQEVAYAALVGGLSGLVMSGGSMATSAAINTTQNLFSGNRAIENGTVDSVMETARQLTETENANDTGYASFQTVKSAYEQLSQSLKTTGGTVQTVKQKMLLGQIKRANTASIFMPFIERSAVNILANAESVAQRYTEFGMKDANGKLLTFTAEDIRSGVDESLLQIAPQERTKEQQKALVKSIRTALTSNSTLSTLAVADATGHITMDTQRFAEASLNGVNLANSADLNYFVEHASKEQIAALSEDLGISDWSALTIDDFRTKVSEFATSEKISEYANQSKRIRAAMQMAQENTKSIPHILRRNMADGVYRFSSENSTVNMAIFKEGETYHLFDYDSGNISRSLSVQEVNKVLRDYWKSETVQTPTVEQFTEETNLGKQTLAIDELATAKIPEYHTLSEPNKQAVRMTMRQAQAHGIAEAETLTFARVAARSGLNIVFDGVKSAIGDANIQGNTIYINPDAPTERLQSRLLLHEAGHALLRGKNGKNLIVEAFKHIAPERSQKIAQQYIDFYREYGFSAEQYMPIVNEEITTAYIEDILGDTNAWEYILSEEPSISQKILSFFRKAAQDYSGDAKLSAEARKLLRTYKKLFAELSAQNQGNNALELTRQDEITKKPVTSTKNENVQVTDNSPRITSGMSDDERYEVLKDKNITISAKTDRTKLEGVMSKLDITESNLDLSKYGDKKRLFKKLGEEFGVFKQYNNPDTKVTFSFSKGGMSESVSKQRKGYMRLAKLLTCIDSVIENAVGIETHNRNDKGYKVDTSLKNVYVLASAFVDGENIIPVKLEVKEFSDKENTLYVAIALESIKKNEIVKQEVATNGVAQQYSPSFNISIADFLRKINPSDESFYKYIPKKLLETSKDGNGQVLNVKSNDSPQPTSKTLLDGITAKSTTSRAADIADHDGSTFEGKHNFTEEISAPIASASDNSIADSAENVNTNSENGNKNMPKERFALKIGDAEVSTKGRYQFETDTETLLRDISEQNSIEHFMPEGLSADFQKAIQRSNGFAFPRLYRGMEAAELDYIVQNGFIKSNSSYNFSYQQDQTRFSPNIQTALSYATGFAPSGIREKFFEQGMPAYIVEVGNYANLDFINEDAIESYTKKNVDVKYITRIIELKFDAEANKVKASDIQIDGMNQAKGELLHGVPSFAQDKVTGTILYKHQGADGFEDGKYISEKRPDILFDYDLVEAHKDMDFDYNRYLGISGDPTNLVDYQYPLEKRFALAETNSNGETLTEQQKEYFKDSHAKDGQGRLLVLYHQTDTDFTEFNTQHEGASARDNETPHGIFLKPTNGNIGLKGNKQMRLYANITNPLKFYTRTDAQQYWKRNIDGYADILAQIAVNDRVYNEQFDEVFDLDGLARKRRNAELSEMRREEIDALYEESEIESQKILDEWEEANTVLDKKAKILIDEYLKDNGYDGVFLLEDQGSFGRKVQTYIALSAEQVKNTDNTNPTVSKDIRFSLPEIDSDGNTISAGQREYFADSKVLDDNGNLLLVYHGTRKADFTEFRRNVNYFTDSMEMADSYSPNGEKYTGYLNISNPYVIDAEGERWSRIPIDAETKQFLDEYGSSTFKEDGAWRTTPADIAAAIEEAVDTGEMDYDGIIIRNVDDTGSYSKNGKTVVANDYIAFNSNQFKNADNINPTTDRDIRYALQDEYIDEIFSDGTDTSNSEQDATFDANAVVARGIPRKAGKANMTIGELRKVVANNTKQKVYSKTDALSVVNKFTGISDLTQKTRAEIADAVWQILNEAPDVEYRRDVAHDMAEFIVAKILVDAKTENAEAQTAQERLSYFRTGIGKLTFSEEDISEIRHVRDKNGLKQVLGRWGYKGTKSTNGIVSSKRTPMDMFVVDIAREMPAMEHLEDMHPVDAFLEIDAMYEQAQAQAKDKWISKYWDMPDSEIPSMIKNIENEIMSAYETEGTQSKFSKRFEGAVSYYKEQAEYWKAEHDKIKGRDRLLGQLMNQAQKMKDLKLGTFANSTQHDSAIFKNSIEQLARTQFRGNLNVSGTRKILSNLRQWYTSDAVKTGILGYVDTNNTGLYVQGVTDMLETLSEGKKGFTKDDLKMLCDVMSYFTKFVENWGKVFRQGKWIEAKPEAERYINTLHANESLKVGLFGKMTGTLYMQTFGDPMTVARRMDRYESGFYTEMTTELRNAATDAQIAEMEVRSAYDDFTNQHKNYVKKASVETVTYRGTEISKMHLIGLYMTMKRKHAWAGLAANGFTFIDGNSKRVRVNGVISPDAKITNAELRQYTTEQLSAIEALLTDTDKKYVAILEQAFNVDARKLKADRDIQRLGFTNATDDYYYPIRRGNIAKNVDTADMASELDRVSNSSFNKDTVRGAKQELFIESADTVFNRHIHAVCQYAYLSPAVEAYNRLYNLDVSGNPNKPISVATESANTWAKGNKYFAKLIADIQGIPATSSEGMRVLGYIRGSYAKFQLGANPKVWITQLSSLFASSSLLDADSIMRGMTVSAQGIDEYCSLAKLRNYDSTATMAQGVLDSKTKRAVSAIGKFNDALMIPIGKMDRFVVRRLFGACQVQVEKNGGARIGTDANKIEAGKMLRQVILETQQNSIATERSAAMRSGNELLRTVTMFTADSMKVIGRVIDSIGEASTIKSKLKITTDANACSLLKQQLKTANRKVRKSVGALTLSAVFMASVAQMFRWLYNKEQDEDESIAETMLVDAVGNLLGGLPLFKDAYSKIFEGYDVDNYAYSAINDLLDSALNVFEVAGNALTNEGSTQDRNRAVRNLAYSVGQLLGVPVRNVYNVLYGLTKRFDPETAYVIDSALYKKNYQNELYQAIENDDAEKTSLIMSFLLGERLNDNVDEAVFNELLILSKNGQKVIPRNIPSSITIDGVEYPISAAEQTAIKNIYTTSEKSLKTLFAKSKYNSLSDEQKAEAIDYIYDTYYDKALEDALGIDRNNSSLAIADVVGVDNLALLYVGTKGLTSDTDKRGNIISGSKRKKVVEAINSLGISTEKKLLLICAKGYSLQDNDIRGLSATKAKKYLLRYILSLKGKTSAEKAEIAELCGFEVVNGKIITKNL